MEYIELQPCPICGTHPEKDKVDLRRPGGHGYPGHYSYQYKCEKCKLLKGEGYTDIYCSPEEAANYAKKFWNAECDRISALITEYRKKVESK